MDGSASGFRAEKRRGEVNTEFSFAIEPRPTSARCSSKARRPVV